MQPLVLLTESFLEALEWAQCIVIPYWPMVAQTNAKLDKFTLLSFLLYRKNSLKESKEITLLSQLTVEFLAYQGNKIPCEMSFPFSRDEHYWYWKEALFLQRHIAFWTLAFFA